MSAARAIEAAINERHPGQYEISLFNIAVASGSKPVTMLYDSYNLMLKASPRYARPGMTLLNALHAEKAIMPFFPNAIKNIVKALQAEAPDIVVSVHPIVNHALIKAFKELGWYGRVPYVIVCTDLTNNFLNGWANDEATKIITFTDMAKTQMITFGVPEEKIVVHPGFAVGPAFFMDTATKVECRQELRLKPDIFTILISMGGMAIPRKTKAAVKELLQSNLPVQLLVICGMNKSLERKMRLLSRCSGGRMRVYGFTRKVAKLMTAADMMIAKPGPGFIMEAVIKELPMLLDHVSTPMPQELGNLQFAVREGVAQAYTSYKELPVLVAKLLNNSDTYQQMKQQMKRIKNTNAIYEVADTILNEISAKQISPEDA